VPEPTRAGTAIATPDMETLVRRLKSRAATGIHSGRSADLPYLWRCTGDHRETGTRCIYTRDAGHHSSGWLKNPDYERCYHLSISFDPLPQPGARKKPGPFHQPTARLWVRLFFGDWQRFIWEEGPKSREGIRHAVRHYRVFCDPEWQPILPRGEVYSTELTELGWRSWSEHQVHPMTDVMESAQ
jgi:hypothetical protein